MSGRRSPPEPRGHDSAVRTAARACALLLASALPLSSRTRRDGPRAATSDSARFPCSRWSLLLRACTLEEIAPPRLPRMPPLRIHEGRRAARYALIAVVSSSVSSSRVSPTPAHSSPTRMQWCASATLSRSEKPTVRSLRRVRLRVLASTEHGHEARRHVRADLAQAGGERAIGGAVGEERAHEALSLSTTSRMVRTRSRRRRARATCSSSRCASKRRRRRSSDRRSDR